MSAALERLDLLQRSLRFRVAALALWTALCLGGFGAWWVAVHAPGAAQETSAAAPQPHSGQAPDEEATPSEVDPTLSQRLAQVEQALRSRSGLPAALVATTAALVGGALVIGLGLALTYAGLGTLAAAAAALLAAFDQTRSLAFVFSGAVGLFALYTALERALVSALSAPGQTMSVARTTLLEASRQRVGAGLAVLLILWLSATTLWLNPEQPLRYRVQSFLQYSVSGAYWITGLIVLFFAAATVAFEQRDRIVWQTFTKPIQPWSYLLGKWLGVMALALCALTTGALGTFLYVEHLRQQPALGEVAPFVNADGSDGLTHPTTDRLILESQVLTARVGVRAIPPEPPPQALRQAVAQRLEQELRRDPSLRDDPRFAEELEQQIRQEFEAQRWSIPPASEVGFAYRDFRFEGLRRARELGLPLTLQYRINGAGDDPSVIFTILFVVNGSPVRAKATVNTLQTIPLRAQAVNEDGSIELRVYNGDPTTGETNQFTFRFPPGGLEVLYTAASYEANFLRVAASLWLKVGFIAAAAIGASAFLSFPVACLLSLVLVFGASTAGFVEQALEEFPYFDSSGAFDPVGAVVRTGALPIVLAFGAYAKINPAASLVDGRLVTAEQLGRLLLMVGGWTAASLLLGWLVFRKRELALYSGG